MANKVVLITGASSGIGAALAALFAESGDTVYGISRRGIAPEGVHPLRADVTHAEEIATAVAAVLREAGRLDTVVLAAGFGIAGAVEMLPEEEVARQVSVNLLGVSHTLAAVTPALRESRGRVLAIGSAAGAFPIPFQAHYSATKAAVEALLRAYAGEVAPFGISVGVALLGDTASDFTSARHTHREGDALYGGRISGSVAKMEKDEQGGTSCERVAMALYRRLTARRLARVFTVGASYRTLLLLRRALPTVVVDRIIARLYR